jgi:hypothetical protein
MRVTQAFDYYAEFEGIVNCLLHLSELHLIGAEFSLGVAKQTDE